MERKCKKREENAEEEGKEEGMEERKVKGEG